MTITWRNLDTAHIAPGTFQWACATGSDLSELTKTARQLGWDPSDFATLLVPHRRATVVWFDGLTAVALPTVVYNDPEEMVDLAEVLIIADDHAVLIIRDNEPPASGFADITAASPPRGPWDVMARTISETIHSYSPQLDGFENDVLEAEVQVFGERRTQPTQRLYGLKREVRELLIAIEPLSDALELLLERLAGTEFAEARRELHVASDALRRTLNRTRSLSDLVHSAIESNLTQVSLQQNEDMRKISAWVAMAAVPTLIAGIYGMNFDTMPELRWIAGYPFALVLMALSVAGLYIKFKKSGWL